MLADPTLSAERASNRIPGAVLFLLLTWSSFVFVEPAPYDVLALVLLVIAFALGLRLPNQAILPALLLALFAATNIFSILLADQSLPDYSLAGFLRYTGITLYLILTFLFFLGMVYRYRTVALNAIWSGYTVAGIIAAVAGIYGYLDLGPGAETLTRNDRAKGFFKDPNVLGPFLVPLLLHHFTRLLDGWRLVQIPRLAVMLLFLLALFFAFSRGAWVNAILAFMIFIPLLFISSRTMGEKMALVFASLLALLALTAGLAYLSSTPALSDMIDKRVNLVNSYDVGEGGRFDTQRKVLPDILLAPQGYGPNQVTPSTSQAPHNVYLKAFAEYGWLGGAAWLVFCALTVIRGFGASLVPTDLRSDTIVVFSCVTSATIQGLTIDTLHWRHYFLLLGILWALIVLARQNSQVGPARAHNHNVSTVVGNPS